MAKEFAVPEFSLSHDKKKELETEYFSGNEDKIREKRWEKRAKENLNEIERIIDEGLKRKKAKEMEEEREEEVKKEIIYEGKGGYIMKISKRENGEYKVSYYLVTKIENIEEAIDKISSYKPIIKD